MNNDQKIPYIESYGPVLQGEGMLIGKPTWFLRLGGCDYRCFACDSMHAVDDKLVEKNKTVMSAEDIGKKVLEEMGTCPLVTISGGNPALWDLWKCLVMMNDAGKLTAVETQGTVYKKWIPACDYITISPKGPCMIGTDKAREGLASFDNFLGCLLHNRWDWDGVSVKVPVFDSADIVFCAEVLSILRLRSRTVGVPFYISIGNSLVPEPALHGTSRKVGMEEMRANLLDRYDKISRLVMGQYPELMNKVTILPQMHVLMYGNELGR